MEKSNVFEDIVISKKGKEYDVAVMYSGGKDSAYLLYLLKEVYKLRVKACIVDNGFENDFMWKPMKDFTDKMGVPLEIIKPGKNNFAKMFNSMITEYELFSREKTNHICFICNNFLWANVVKYASDNDIPFVASGLSLMQLSSGRPYPLEPNKAANSIAEKSTKVIFNRAIAAFKQSGNYHTDIEFKKFIDDMSEIKSCVKTIYPYIYHQISIDELKNLIVSRGWVSPNKVDVKDYISSGCRIMKYVIPELEKIGMITLNEREQAKAMVESGLADEKELEFASYDATKDIPDFSHELFDEIDVKKFLLSLKD